jgi:hypothetical protein
MKRYFRAGGAVLKGALLLSLAGCVSPQTRGQSAEETEREKDLDVRTVGEVTEVSNVQPIQVSGVGVVTGLEGTGHSPPGAWRTMLEQQLRKQKIENVKALLDSPNNCLVFVTAFIPPGSRKGDVLDVEVTLPPGSKATSLRGGYLQDCILRDYETRKHLMPTYDGGDRLLPGHVLAHARGPLLVGFGNPDEPAEQRRARIWGGGISNLDRPFYLLLKNDEKSARIANAVAERLNLMFQDDNRVHKMIQQNSSQLFLLDDVTQQLNQKQDRGEMARAVNKEMIFLRVPYAYRYNAERYLRVARLMPLREVPEKQGRYRRRLQKMLLDPSDTIRAALRLEALGKESVPALKRGLDSDYPLVRFAAAEALAYLGTTAGAHELARLAEQQTELRMFCLMALSSLDEGICRTKLSEMLTLDDPSLRCGAFRALRLLDESAPRLRRDLGGELLGNSFWLHRVGPQSPRLVHFALGKKAEIVLFGEDIQISAVKVLAGSEFAVSVEPSDDRCTVSRITTQGVARKQCTLRLDDVLRTMADLGAGYPEAVDLLRKLDDRQALNCPIAANALPTLISVEDLADAGRNPNFLRDVAPRRKEAE